MAKYSIILVDDHTMVREGLRQLLMTFPDVSVIAEGGNGYEAIELAQEHHPDIMIIDISMPKLRGVEAIMEIKAVSPETKILVLSMYDHEEYIKQSLKNGASGYLLKNSASEELMTAIQQVTRGEMYLSPPISRQIVSAWVSDTNLTGTSVESPLTNREAQVLKLLAEGYSNKQVAEMLHVSIKTVETHRYRIMEKLELDSFAALVKYAIKSQLVELN